MIRRKQTSAVTIKDIAARLNMSHSTVSRALNDKGHLSEETKAAVRRAADELGYVPNLSARMIRGDANALVGLVIPDVRNDFYSRIAKELAQRCRAEGLRMLLAITDDEPETEKTEIRALLEARVSGIIGTLTSAPLPATLALLTETPFIQLVRRLPKLQTGSVCMADAAGCQSAADHLLDLGHRRIAYVGTSKSISAGRERLRGYLHAHEIKGVAPLADGVELVPPRQEFGYDAVNRLLSHKTRPTAIILGSSELSIGGLRAIREAGLAIPEDISVVGYGDPVWFDLLSPPLTAVGLPVPALAEAATGLLLGAIDADGAAPARNLKVAPQLVVRGSTAPARKARGK